MARFVLVHGAFCGAWIWGPTDGTIEDKKAMWRRSSIYPGWGEDHTPVSEITLDSCADRLREVLSSHPEPAIVVGHSMGGIIATQGAARCRERVAALVYVTAFLPQGRPKSS
jgi:pimeloyl-ACP methyl ester carboxylesterase